MEPEAEEAGHPPLPQVQQREVRQAVSLPLSPSLVVALLNTHQVTNSLSEVFLLLSHRCEQTQTPEALHHQVVTHMHTQRRRKERERG